MKAVRTSFHEGIVEGSPTLISAHPCLMVLGCLASILVRLRLCCFAVDSPHDLKEFIKLIQQPEAARILQDALERYLESALPEEAWLLQQVADTCNYLQIYSP